MTLRDAQLGWGGVSSVYRRLTVSVSLGDSVQIRRLAMPRVPGGHAS